MNDTMRKWLRLGLMCLCLVSCAMFLFRLLEKEEGSDTYDRALELAMAAAATQPETTEATQPPETIQETQGDKRTIWVAEAIPEDDENLEKLRAIDIRALQAVNPDVLGWIYMPESKINYPILQGEDNDFYLKNTWEKRPNSVGSIFMEAQNDGTFTQFNTILYGHNMNDGSMFHDVSRLPEQIFFQRHPYVYIVLPDYILRYEFFASYRAELDSAAYKLSFRLEDTRTEFLTLAKENSRVESEVEPATTDRILTLSTCATGTQTRWVAHARLKMIPYEG